MKKDSNEQQLSTQSDHCCVGGIEGGKLVAENGKNESGRTHHCKDKDHRGAPGPANALRIISSRCISDPNRGCRADARSGHITDRCKADGDLMGSKWHRSDRSDQYSSGGKCAHFKQILKAGGNTDRNDPPNALPFNPFWEQISLILGIVRVKEKVENHAAKHDAAREQSGITSAHDAELRKAPFSEDQQVVQQDIQEVGSQTDIHGRPRIGQAFSKLFDAQEEHEGKDAGDQNTKVGKRECQYICLLPRIGDQWTQ
ncbi:MAG: Uncharacterised protein [Flavobacteriia bacterium]|nr:MAG: Uncharacterised protein [Flavobacteriia bacterium]